MLGGIICSGNTTAWAATRNVFGASMAAAVLYLFGLHDLWLLDFCIAVGATSRCISAALSQGEHLFRPTGRGDSPSQPRVNIVGPGKDGHGGQLGHANLTLASGATLDP